MNRPDLPASGEPFSPRAPGVSHLYQELREQILELTLRPGEELDEAALAERFGRSRTSVREALLNLSTESLVELLPNRGARVAHFDLLELPRFIEAIDLVSRAINRYAALRRTREQFVRIREHHDRFVECARDQASPTALTARNRQFHMAVAEAADNVHLSAAYRQLHQQGIRTMHLALGGARTGAAARSGHIDRVLADHRDLLDAIDRGDADAAEAAARSHTEIFRERIAACLASDQDNEIAIDP